MQEEGSLGVGPIQCTFFVCFRNLRVMDRLFQYTAQKNAVLPILISWFSLLIYSLLQFCFSPFYHTWHMNPNRKSELLLQ